MSTNLHQELTAPSEALDNDSIQPSEAPPLLQREAIELDEPVDPVREGVLPSGTAKPTTSPAHLGQRIKIFWGRQISIVVPHDDCVDHFANERTYLAYLRTSSAFATLGTIVRQLFLLQNREGFSSTASFPYGEALTIICMTFAIIVAISGAFRFWRQQNAIARAKAHAGGWEVYTTGLTSLIVLVAILVIVLISDAREQS